MSLSKLCHIHFPATKLAEQRLIKLGEEKFRIFKVGAPQLDDINLKKIKEKITYFLTKKNFFLMMNISFCFNTQFLVIKKSILKI